MKKAITLGMILLTVFLILHFAAGCSSSSGDSGGPVNSPSPSPSPTLIENEELSLDEVFGPVDEQRYGISNETLLVIISDIHMGDQRSIDQNFGWFIKNEDHLSNFLNHVAARPRITEMVIAGDFFDEWVIPMEDETLNGFSPDPEGESKFVDSIAEAHPKVIEGIRKIIASNKKVTYVPGNHDMLVTGADFDRIFPGISQARDASGLGAYSPDGLPEVVIEHGHRYDFFNAPDMDSNRKPASPEDYTKQADAILPPGFFVSKIAATHGFQYPAMSELEPIARYTTGPVLYWAAWKLVLGKIKPTEDPAAKIIKTGIDGYTDIYAINDLSPHLKGFSVQEPLLYSKIEDNWHNRQVKNLVNVPITVASGLLVGSVNEWCDFQANTQYFLHESSKRVVVFGHTHKATLGYRLNTKLQKCIYANSGTWIDNGDPSRTLAVIQTGTGNDGKTKVTVSVYQYTEKETLIKLYSDSYTR